MSGRERHVGKGAPWTADFEPPPPPRTDRVRLEVLGPEVATLDHAAIMGSRERLHDELQPGRLSLAPPAGRLGVRSASKPQAAKT